MVSVVPGLPWLVEWDESRPTMGDENFFILESTPGVERDFPRLSEDGALYALYYLDHAGSAVDDDDNEDEDWRRLPSNAVRLFGIGINFDG
jgi:hypothetical protein